MSKGYAKTIVVGRVVKKPTMDRTLKGTPTTRFTLAVNDKIGDQETTDYFDFIATNKQAETCVQYFVPGKLIIAEGRPRVRRWEKAGSKGIAHEIYLKEFTFLPQAQSSSQNSQQSGPDKQTNTNRESCEDVEVFDDIPM